MSWRPVYWLAAAAGIMALFMVVFERRQPAPARRLALDDAALVVDAAAVTALTVAEGTSVVACVQRDGRWYVTRPVATRASGPVIHDVLRGVAATRIRERITPQQMVARDLTLASYGLKQPRFSVTVTAAGATRTLAFGDDAPVGNLVFAQVDSDLEVLSVTREAVDAPPKRVEDWQARAALPDTVLSASRLEIKQPGGFVQLALKDGTWRLQQPHNVKADDAVVERLLQGLHQLQIESAGPAVTGVDLAVYGLGPEDNPLQVTAGTGAGDDVTLLLGKPVQEAPGLVNARVSDMAALCRVSQAAVALLSVRAEDVRDRRLCVARPAGIAALRLQDEDRRLELARANGGWRIDDPVRGRADLAAVGQFLKAFCGLESAGFPNPASTNPAAAEAVGCRVVLSDRPFTPGGTNGPAASRTAGVWTYRFPAAWTGDVVEVTCDEERTVYRVRAGDLANLVAHEEAGVRRSFTDPLAYLDRAVFELQPASVRRITLAYRGREEAVAHDAAGNWTAESPPEARVVPEAVAGILQSAAPLRVARIETLSTTNPAAFGLNDSATRLTFSLNDNAGLQKTLIITTNGITGGVYGAVQGQDAVFVIPRDTAARLTRSMVVWQ